MKKIICRLLISLSFIVSSSCEYETEKDYFKEIEQPSENVNIKINLSNIPEGETIYIYANTSLSYTINTNNKQLLNTDFTLDGQRIGSFNNSIYLYPNTNEGKEQELKVKVECNSNTGSLADKLLLEKYTGEFTYKIKYIKSDLKLIINQEFTNEGYLKLIWSNPDLKQTPIEKYEITYYDVIAKKEQTFEINNQEENFFIDKDYVYGFREYKIKTFFKDNKIREWTDLYTAQYKELTTDDLNLNLNQKKSTNEYFEFIWSKPNITRMPVSKYVLEYYDDQLKGKQSITIDDVDKTSYIDENYAYGDRNYTLTIYLCNDAYKFTTNYKPKYRILTSDDLIFEDIDLETTKVSWPKNEFNCTQIIRLFDKENIKIDNKVNSITFKRPPFPADAYDRLNIELFILGEKTQYDPDRHPDYYSQGKVNSLYISNAFRVSSDVLSFVPYAKKNLLYIVSREGIASFDIKTMKVTDHLSFKETIATSMTCDPYSSKIAIRDGGNIKIYSDNTFTKPINFDLQYWVAAYNNILKFTSDNKLLISSSISNYTYTPGIDFAAFDANTGDFLYKIAVETSGKIVNGMGISSDNKYLYLRLDQLNNPSATQVNILELNGRETRLIKTFTNNELIANGFSFFFNSNNPTQLVQSNNSKFIVSELPGFNKIAEVNGEFSSVDIVNGNFLYTTRDGFYLDTHILDPSLKKELLVIKTKQMSNILSYNNLFFSSWQYGGFYLDISKFIK